MFAGLDILAVVTAGMASTVIITLLMAVGPKIGMPKMDMPAMLGSMFGAPGSWTLGLIIHFMMGIIFTFIYALLWNNGIGAATVGSGILFGLLHWLVVGLMMGMMPKVHLGNKSGEMPEPGVYMLKNGGTMGFMGGLIGHIVFAIVVVQIYPII